MKNLRNMLESFMNELDDKLDISMSKLSVDILETFAELQRDMILNIGGNQIAGKRARVKSVDLEKKLKEFRRMSVCKMKRGLHEEKSRLHER